MSRRVCSVRFVIAATADLASKHSLSVLGARRRHIRCFIVMSERIGVVVGITVAATGTGINGITAVRTGCYCRGRNVIMSRFLYGIVGIAIAALYAIILQIAAACTSRLFHLLNVVVVYFIRVNRALCF